MRREIAIGCLLAGCAPAPRAAEPSPYGAHDGVPEPTPTATPIDPLPSRPGGVELRKVSLSWGFSAGSHVDSHDVLVVQARAYLSRSWPGGGRLVAVASCGEGRDTVVGEAVLRDQHGPIMVEPRGVDGNVPVRAIVFNDRRLRAREPCEVNFQIVPDEPAQPAIEVGVTSCLAAGVTSKGSCGLRRAARSSPPPGWHVTFSHLNHDFSVHMTALDAEAGDVLTEFWAECPDGLFRRSDFGASASELWRLSGVHTLHAGAQLDPEPVGRCELYALLWRRRPGEDFVAPFEVFRGCYDAGDLLDHPCDAAATGRWQGPPDAPLAVDDIRLSFDPTADRVGLHLEAGVTVLRRLPEADELAVDTVCDVPGAARRGSVQMSPSIGQLWPGEGEALRDGIYDTETMPRRCTVDIGVEEEGWSGGRYWHLARACIERAGMVPCPMPAPPLGERPRRAAADPSSP